MEIIVIFLFSVIFGIILYWWITDFFLSKEAEKLKRL